MESAERQLALTSIEGHEHPIMDWDKLKSFHAAAEAGSLTAAGERLGISQSAVSRQIAALEEHLGVSLFQRRHGACRFADMAITGPDDFRIALA